MDLSASQSLPVKPNAEVEKNYLDFTHLTGMKSFGVSSSSLALMSVLVLVPFLASLIVPGSIGAIFGFVVLLVLAGIAGTLYINYQQLSKHNEQLMLAFVSANNLQYFPGLSVANENKPGSLFTHGHSKKMSKVIQGSLDALPFSLFKYDYTVGSGKSRRDYDAEVMEITLPRKLPHMVIDSLLENGNGGFSTLPITFSQSQRLDLEGDFYKYFRLYAPDTYAVSALTIIAPDAMETLMQHAALCDLEIIDNKLYFYWPQIACTRKHYEDIFLTVDAVLKEIGKKLTTDNIFATVSQERVHSSADTAGVRLKRRNFSLYFVGIVVLSIVQMSSQIFEGLSRTLPFVSVPITFGVVFYVLFRMRRRTQLLNDLKNRFTTKY